ncbi:MAG: hypothetical protein HY869_02850 [Chloroflexi bacterium]|nr:hypothetical protein [Chloroflexota bacterium]
MGGSTGVRAGLARSARFLWDLPGSYIEGSLTPNWPKMGIQPAPLLDGPLPDFASLHDKVSVCRQREYLRP